MVSSAQNKASFRRYVEEVWTKGNLDVAEEIFSKSYVSHQSDGSQLERTPQDVKRFVREWREAFSVEENTLEEQVAEGDKVATRWRLVATHQGEFRGIAPTGKRIVVTGIGIFRFSEEGKVVESWDAMDQLGMMRQMGAIPESGQAQGA